MNFNRFSRLFVCRLYSLPENPTLYNHAAQNLMSQGSLSEDENEVALNHARIYLHCF